MSNNKVSDCFITAIALYTKGWYGHFTGNSDPFPDLKKIISVLALMEEQYISEKDCFRLTHSVFHELVKKEPMNDNWYTDLFMEALYPNFMFDSEKTLSPQQMLINKMLRMIAQIPVQYFPQPELPYHIDLLIKFDVSNEMINRKKELNIKV